MFVKAASILLTILKVLVILAIMFIVVRCLKKVLKKVEANKKVLTKQKGQIGWKLASNAAIVAVYALGIIAAVNQVPSISAALTTVLAGSGILAVIVGFAAQESFGNLVSGVFLPMNIIFIMFSLKIKNTFYYLYIIFSIIISMHCEYVYKP